MQKLILLRHAKSSWEDPSLEDHARPLNARGRASAPKIGAWLRENGHRPSLILCSDAARTRETLQCLGFEGIETRFLPALYHASPATMLSLIDRIETDSLLVIGHNPGMAELAMKLATSAPDHPHFARFPTAATLVLERDSGKVLDFVVPREL